MNKIARFIIKIVITIILFSFFGGCLRGFAQPSQSPALIKGLEAFAGAIIFFGTLYGVWTYKPNSENKDDEITLRKD